MIFCTVAIMLVISEVVVEVLPPDEHTIFQINGCSDVLNQAVL